jgi:hypothetical protein
MNRYHSGISTVGPPGLRWLTWELSSKLRIEACCALSIILDLLLPRDRVFAAGQGVVTLETLIKIQ